MTGKEIRQKFLEYMKGKGHAVVPSSSLIPDDPSVLLTTAGMQQFKKYYTGEADVMRDFGAKSTASVQKSFRTSDFESVGDESHLTLFEMLGNFSFGGYFKKEAITYGYEFITKVMGLKISYVTIFEGKADIGVPKDEESMEIWKSLDPQIKIIEQGMDDVFWGPTGSAGPCGPTTEIYCKNAKGQDIEVWNIVFNQFYFPGSREELNSGATGKKLEPLPTPGVDTGMGLERLVMVSQNTPTIFDTDLFTKPFGALFAVSGDERSKRIVADHLRASVFLLADGVRPSNKERGYILRRLIRRLIVHFRRLGSTTVLEDLLGYITAVIKEYGQSYLELNVNSGAVADEFRIEAKKFSATLEKGLKEFDKKYPNLFKFVAEKMGVSPDTHQITILGKKVGKDAFDLYQSFGFPLEVIGELLVERGYEFDEAEFRAKLDEEIKKHQEISRAGGEKKFGGHGLILDTGELKAGNEEELKKVTRLHTATHMLQKALREVLGSEVHQAGSDITTERTRFDFTFPRKLTPEEIQKVEAIVNEKVAEGLPMNKVVLPKDEAEKTGALYFFKEKYPDPVSVYCLGKDIETAWSKEFCGGPHVNNSAEVGKVRIIKEEAVASGVRRIRATVE